MKTLLTKTKMKKISFPLLFFYLLLSTSCTKVIYTHQQVMNQFQTKQDVVNRFGLPAQKRSGEGIEEWLYDYGTVYTRVGFGNSNTNTSISGYGNSIYANTNSNSQIVSQFSQYNRYIKFTFNNEGNITRWDTNVNMTEKAPAPGKTVLYLLICVAAGVGLAIASNGGN